MAIVQKTIILEVYVTVDVDEDLIGTEGVDDPYDVAHNVADGMQSLDDFGDLYKGGTVKEYSVNVLDVQNV